MIFVGSKFCSHCGAKVAGRTELSASTPLPCPHCKTPLAPIVIGNTELYECPDCEGIWADVDELDRICADREKQAAVLGAAAPFPATDGVPLEKVRYRPCPVCDKLMNRVNFARCSHVVVDVCRGHGTWLDRDELRRIVEFIRAGGLDLARAKEIGELERQRGALREAERQLGSRVSRNPEVGGGISAIGLLLRSFLR